MRPGCTRIRASRFPTRAQPTAPQPALCYRQTRRPHNRPQRHYHHPQNAQPLAPITQAAQPPAHALPPRTQKAHPPASHTEPTAQASLSTGCAAAGTGRRSEGRRSRPTQRRRPFPPRLTRPQHCATRPHSHGAPRARHHAGTAPLRTRHEVTRHEPTPSRHHAKHASTPPREYTVMRVHRHASAPSREHTVTAPQHHAPTRQQRQTVTASKATPPRRHAATPPRRHAATPPQHHGASASRCQAVTRKRPRDHRVTGRWEAHGVTPTRWCPAAWT
jgi:RNA-binding protein with serine-rich domain 1